MTLDILCVTGSRADWGLLKSPARHLADDPRFALRLLATGTHLSEAYGSTVREIEADGFTVDHRVAILDADVPPDSGAAGGDAGDDAAAATRALARAVDGVGAVLADRPPDLMLVLGDRYEILGAVNAAALARVPVAHLCGGDITEGAVDDAIRHAITKMSHLHFVTNADAAGRVRQMGEDPARVHTVGSPGLDALPARDPEAGRRLRTELGLRPHGPLVLVTFHPVTLDPVPGPEQFDALAGALDDARGDAAVLLTGSNADAEGRTLSRMAEEFASRRDNTVYRPSLGHANYLTALGTATAVVGNSSSGLYEAPSFGIPTVNVGDRQAGRPQASSVIDCPAERVAIAAAIRQAFATDARGTANPYGDGRAGARIAAILADTGNLADLLRKRFDRW